MRKQKLVKRFLASALVVIMTTQPICAYAEEFSSEVQTDVEDELDSSISEDSEVSCIDENCLDNFTDDII